MKITIRLFVKQLALQLSEWLLDRNCLQPTLVSAFPELILVELQPNDKIRLEYFNNCNVSVTEQVKKSVITLVFCYLKLLRVFKIAQNNASLNEAS